MIRDFSHMDDDGFRYKYSLYESYVKYRDNHKFMKQALQLDGQNNLRDYMISHCIELDTDFCCKLTGLNELPPLLKICIEYNAIASMEISISWILEDMPIDIDTMVKCTTQIRATCMNSILDAETAAKFEEYYLK